MESLDRMPLPQLFYTVFLGDFSFYLVRYAFTAGLAFLVVWVLGRSWFAARRIQPHASNRARLWKELGWSLSTMVVFALLACVVVLLKRAGLTAVYQSIAEYGPGYYVFSWVAVLLIHDTYFYWAHRFMHWGPVYRRVHSVHHQSTNPSPLAAFAFHPLEAVVEYFFFIPMIMVLPLHQSVLHLYPALMLVLNAYGHLGYEFLPASVRHHPVGRLFITATLHNTHHKRFHCNYGLWFYWWDYTFGTIDVGRRSAAGQQSGQTGVDDAGIKGRAGFAA